MSLKRIGALWIRDGKQGKFMAGEIEVGGDRIPVMVFRNRKGENPRRPDYQVMVKEEEGQGGETPRDSGPADFNDDDIPF